MKIKKRYVWPIACIFGISVLWLLWAMFPSYRSPRLMGKFQVVRGDLKKLAGSLRSHYEQKDEYPSDLQGAGILAEEIRDPFTSKMYAYVTATDKEGKRFACMIASPGSDGQYQIDLEAFKGANVGRFPSNWNPPASVSIFREGIRSLSTGGDIYIQMIRNQHCMNQIDIHMQGMSNEELSDM